MSAEERNVVALEAVTFEGEVLDTIEINPPAGEYSTRLERVMSGLLINARSNVFFREVYADERTAAEDALIAKINARD